MCCPGHGAIVKLAARLALLTQVFFRVKELLRRTCTIRGNKFPMYSFWEYILQMAVNYKRESLQIQYLILPIKLLLNGQYIFLSIFLAFMFSLRSTYYDFFFYVAAQTITEIVFCIQVNKNSSFDYINWIGWNCFFFFILFVCVFSFVFVFFCFVFLFV